MLEGWALWLLLVGFVTGAALTAVLLWRLPRREDDVAAGERRAEAGWIARVIEGDGGVAPEPFVEEVLELHQAYLAARFTPGPPPGVAPSPLPAPAWGGPATAQPGPVPPPPDWGPPGAYPPGGTGAVPPSPYPTQPGPFPPRRPG